ncbi:MAG: hypothetical protein K2J08_01045 [Ruminococcus sp.]|nr:hypothetical protein [Ruminococcus sp.]
MIPYYFYNCKTKHYIDGSTKSVICNNKIFRDPLVSINDCMRDVLFSFSRSDVFNPAVKKIYNKAKKISEYISGYSYENKMNAFSLLYSDSEFDDVKSKLFPRRKNQVAKFVRSDSIKRAKDSIFDYVLNNNFNYFFTGTINPQKMNSKDPKEVFGFIQNWLKDRVKRDNLSYIMIAEYHKKGGIHFHGLFNCDSAHLNFVDSGTKLYKGLKKPIKDHTAIRKGLIPSDGRIVYNVAKWKFGFTDCIALSGDKLFTAKYITKYITKNCKKIFGKFFWHSRDLKKPDITVENVDYNKIRSKEYYSEYTGFLKYVFRSGDENRLIERQKNLDIFMASHSFSSDFKYVYNVYTGEIVDEYFDLE